MNRISMLVLLHVLLELTVKMPSLQILVFVPLVVLSMMLLLVLLTPVLHPLLHVLPPVDVLLLLITKLLALTPILVQQSLLVAVIN